MIVPDTSQQRVLALDPTRHARVLGAPGTGKTSMLVEAYARALEQTGRSEGDVLVLAPSRLAASRLRAALETRAARALGGTPARTPESFAFAVLSRFAALSGDDAPRLLTGTAHDEAVAETVERRLAGAGAGLFLPEVLRGPAFRAELREFWRVLDDFDLEPRAFAARLSSMSGRSRAEAITDAPDDALLDRWIEALGIVAEVDDVLLRERPDELSASALLRAAAKVLRTGGIETPELLLVDDAQELGEGHLALLAACAAAGSAVWMFGDPDVATETFHGERARVMTGLAAEFARRGAKAEAEQAVVLGTVHRHGGALRRLVRDLTRRIGGAGEQRAAQSADDAQRDDPGRRDPAHPQSATERVTVSGTREATVQFALARSASEQLGVIAHRLRSRRLGLGGEKPVPWQRMAVICRSRDETVRVSRVLASQQVPTGVAAGGIVLREHRVVQDLIRLLQHALGIEPLTGQAEGESAARSRARAVQQLLGGPLGGLDPVAVRRLRGALMMQERREARADEREARDTDELLLEAFAFPGADAAIDSAGGRALRRLALLAAAGVRKHAAGGTARETLWAIWSAARLPDGTTLADAWQRDALDERGSRAEEADHSLDAVTGLFFALQRHEEQGNAQPVAELLEQLLDSAVPEDTLARRSARDAVTVTTPQGATGLEFDLVAVVGAQDGAWPNVRSRGSLLGTIALEHWLRGEEPTEASRRDTIHDELRLFAQACSRASRELLVVAVSDDEQHPSPFFRFGRDHLCEELPSSRLTLRGATAAMRRRLAADPADTVALDTLAELAAAGVPGAHPDEWYGALPPSSDAPVAELGDPEHPVPVSPSQLEKAENCPLDWVVSLLGGGSSSLQMNLGTLIHHAFETAQHPDSEGMLATVDREWRKLSFDAEWEAERAHGTAEAMVAGLADYLREFETSDRVLLGRESEFSLILGDAELRGKADRLEGRETAAGIEVTVLDLKTGTTPPSGPATAQHAQLMAYQLGVALGAFVTEGERVEGATSGGARLLYVHPDATRGKGFVERVQQPLDEDTREAFTRRVAEVATIMAAASFDARVDHHCSDPYAHGDCRLHIIPAVSHA